MCYVLVRVLQLLSPVPEYNRQAQWLQMAVQVSARGMAMVWCS